VDALDISSEHLERVHDDHEKLMVPLDAARLAHESLPIASIAILERGGGGIERLDRQSALVELLRHSYAPRIMRALGRQAEHMAQCARLAGSLTVLRAGIARSDESPIEVDRLVDHFSESGWGE
jgi:hypothetical protein